MSGVLESPEGETVWDYRYVLTFDETGAFVVRNESNEITGTGICMGQACAYALRPNAVLSTAGTLLFGKESLTRTHSNLRVESRETTLAVSTMARE